MGPHTATLNSNSVTRLLGLGFSICETGLMASATCRVPVRGSLTGRRVPGLERALVGRHSPADLARAAILTLPCGC